MSFMVFPPEVNSGMMYTGPGSGSLTTAAAAWDGLASDLNSTATSVQSAISGLTGSWQGPSSAALVSAATPYVAWLENTAAQAGQAGMQAKTAAGLFETAHAATVPPPMIEANRALLLALISTNFFGQNTPAIMATEAHYMEMWAQDGAALDTYMASSHANTAALHAQQPTPAPPVSKDFGQDTAAAAQSLAHSAANNAMPLDATGQGPGLTDGGLTNLLNSLGSSAGGDPSGAGLGAGGLSALRAIYYPALLASLPARILPSMLMQLARAGSMGSLGSAASHAGAAGAGTSALMTQIGTFVDGKLGSAVGTLAGHFTSATNAISAKLAHAASVGALKVPQAWSMAADGMTQMTRAAPVLPHTTVNAPAQAMSSGMPGGPFGNAMMGALAGRGMGSVAAKAPKIIPRSPAGG